MKIIRVDMAKGLRGTKTFIELEGTKPYTRMVYVGYPKLPYSVGQEILPAALEGDGMELLTI